MHRSSSVGSEMSLCSKPKSKQCNHLISSGIFKFLPCKIFGWQTLKFTKKHLSSNFSMQKLRCRSSSVGSEMSSCSIPKSKRCNRLISSGIFKFLQCKIFGWQTLKFTKKHLSSNFSMQKLNAQIQVVSEVRWACARNQNQNNAITWFQVEFLNFCLVKFLVGKL